MIRVGAWYAYVERKDVRTYGDTLWFWYVKHDAVGSIASGFARSEAAAEMEAEQELAKWTKQEIS